MGIKRALEINYKGMAEEDEGAGTGLQDSPDLSPAENKNNPIPLHTLRRVSRKNETKQQLTGFITWCKNDFKVL